LQSKQLVTYVVFHSESSDSATEDVHNDMRIDELRHYLQQQLPEYMVPPSYMVLDALPLTANGKVDRKRLPTPELIGDHHSPDTYIPPRNRQELQMVKLWEEILEVQPIGVRSNFFDLGGHSLLAVRLMNRIEQDFGRSLPLATLFQAATIEQLAVILQQEQGVASLSPLVPIQPQGNQQPIFCVHPAGGTVFCYLELSHLLGSDQPFYGLQSLGQQEGQAPLTTVEEMATVYLAEIGKVQAQGPYLLMGWSFGGMVALQMAHDLLSQGEQVAFLGLLDTYAPAHMPDEQALSEDVEVVLELFGGPLSLDWEVLRELPSEQQAAFILEQARQGNLVPPDLEAAQIERLLQLMKLNHKAMRSYSPPNYPDVITLLHAEAGSVAVSSVEMTTDPTLGWQAISPSKVEVHTIPGYHEYMVHQPTVAIVAETLKACIEKTLNTEL
ncbi:alpha/beta fold hydrolase, partial [Moorena sp. SIO2C4]|uniref:thioesterase domain-containing protein n=1 Tax=Moorena sp. SIO2C4 TaxID=2607824 RepID=UPI0013C83691